MSSCVYDTYTGTAFGLIQLLPWVVPTFLTVASFTKDRRRRQGFEFTPFWFSFYLSFWQLIIYELQMSFHAMRADPFCTNVFSAAFPSTTVFYTTSGVSFIVLFTFVWNHVITWNYWLYLFVLQIGPPSYLVWVQYNTVAEVLISAALGVAATAIYIIFVYAYAAERMPFILNSQPCRWFCVTDNYLMNDDDEELSEQMRSEYETIDKKFNK